MRRFFAPLIATLMLALSLVVVSGSTTTPANAAGTCDAPYYTKVDSSSGSVNASGTWGTLTWNGTSSTGDEKKKLYYTVNSGFRLEVCTKAGNAVNDGVSTSGVFVGPTSGHFLAQTGISHIGYRVTVLVPDNQVPAAPDCDTPGSYTLPSDTAAIDWSITPAYTGPGTYTVRAALNVANTYWSDGSSADKTWTVTVLAATGDCPKTPVTVPANQVPTAPDCDTDGSYTLPQDDAQIDWSISPAYAGPGTYTVTASLINPGTHEWSDETSADKTWTVTVLAATGDCPPPPCPEGEIDWNGPNEPGCGNPPTPPTPVQLTENVEGCTLASIGFPDSAGTAVRTGLREYVLAGTEYVLEPLSDVQWGAWTVTEYTDAEYFEKCASGQPDPIIREVAGVEASCALQGTLSWVDVYTTEYVWNTETLTWELGEEVGPVRTDEVYVAYSDEEFEEECVDEPEVAGEQTQVIKHELPEVKGEQAGVPTAVDAGIGTEESPLGSRRNPLWLLAVGGGLGLMGSAGWRRRAAANR